MLLKAHLFLAYREFREHVKDLSCISTNFCRIVIVDNNPFSFLLQPVNGIPCIPSQLDNHMMTRYPGIVFKKRNTCHHYHEYNDVLCNQKANKLMRYMCFLGLCIVEVVIPTHIQMNGPLWVVLYFK